MLRTTALATLMAVALVTSASAMSFAPAIPTPVNPHPVNPVATDGSPLPSKWGYDWTAGSMAPLSPMNEVLGADGARVVY